MMVNALDYYKEMRDAKIILIYCGPVWSISVEELGETISKRLEFDDLSASTSHSIFSVFVEQMNNISMYSAEKERFDKPEGKVSEVAKGVFILGYSEKSYFLQSGNLLEDRSVELIKNKIDYLCSLDRPALRKFYKEQLNSENTNPESRGAGLGLTEIAKLASSKIKYDFTPMENGLTFFTMFVEIGGGK